jgi:hypothetical protein
MDLKILIPLIEKASPILGELIEGPAGAIVASLIASVFGGDPANPSDLANRITADPDPDFKIKQLVLQNKDAIIALRSHQLDVAAAQQKEQIQDIQNARDHDKNNKYISLALLCLIPFLFISICLTVLFIWISSDDAVDHILTLFGGTLIAVFMYVCKKTYDYYYGGVG